MPLPLFPNQHELMTIILTKKVAELEENIVLPQGMPLPLFPNQHELMTILDEESCGTRRKYCSTARHAASIIPKPARADDNYLDEESCGTRRKYCSTARHAASIIPKPARADDN